MESFLEWLRRRQKGKKITPHADNRIDSFLKSVDNLEADWKELENILDKKQKDKGKVKPPVAKPKPDLDVKKPPKTIGKPDEEDKDHLDEPGKEEEEGEDQEQQSPMRKPLSRKPSFRRFKPGNDEE